MPLANKLIDIYYDIPLLILNVAAPLFNVIPAKWRYGKAFNSQYRGLIERQFVDKKAVEDYVDKSVHDIVLYAYEHVPFYRKLYNSVGVDISTILTSDDLLKLPIIDKDVVRDHVDQMISDESSMESMAKLSTSGSTGKPLEIYQDSDIAMREWAYSNYLFSRIGYKPGVSTLVMTGRAFQNQIKKGMNWQWDPLKRELRVNVSSMNEENLCRYCIEINKHKPEFIHGYMSAIVLLTKYIEQHPIKHRFKGVIAISETIYDAQREYVERVLNVRLYSFYGHTERLVIAGECEYSHDYHVEPSYGFVELINENNELITKSGEKGEIVATGFLNRGMPLIRYKTGDIAEWSSTNECQCGRNCKKLKRVYGRVQEFFIKGDSTKVPYTMMENIHSDVFQHVLRYQYYQDTVGVTVLKVVPGLGYSNLDRDNIKNTVEEKLGEGMAVMIQEVTEIPTKKNGKLQLIDQCIQSVKSD